MPPHVLLQDTQGGRDARTIMSEHLLLLVLEGDDSFWGNVVASSSDPFELYERASALISAARDVCDVYDLQIPQVIIDARDHALKMQKQCATQKQRSRRRAEKRTASSGPALSSSKKRRIV